ncbi:hypothetical protein [Frateuria sp. STR12]|uniref:hypothetical protein n=1 Tax=Frateuria hangzhouensis TaxID=2995589 RepID=UPI002260EB85|nr:hypothetical protein [Frateuria sp. STR12]MCX7513206.1 hypothetical protein [Frateuria sp. STR12]
MTRVTMVLAVALLAGCASTVPKPKPPAEPGVGSASYRSATDSSLAHYRLALGQIAMGATLEAHEPPAYPKSMLAACAALVELPARVIVAADGHVSDVRIDPAPTRRSFVAAVRQAVREWRYAPLTITRWASDANGTSHPVDRETKPFSLDYVFSFRCEHGHASVSSGPDPARR